MNTKNTNRIKAATRPIPLAASHDDPSDYDNSYGGFRVHSPWELADEPWWRALLESLLDDNSRWRAVFNPESMNSEVVFLVHCKIFVLLIFICLFTSFFFCFFFVCLCSRLRRKFN